MPTRKPKATRKRSEKAPRSRAAAPPVALPDRRLMERHLASMTRLLAEQEFATPEEADAYLQDLLQRSGGKLPAVAPATPLEEAQDLVYQALEQTGRKRLELARKALTVSPDCADAYVLLAEGTRDPHEARRLYEQGVAAGERALGPELFANEAGNFWGIFETRPYMRARLGLAQVLWHLGERRAAVEHLQEMLRLNPNDNQGVRHVLMHWLLAVGDVAALDQLLKQYPEEGFAAYEYTRALMLFRRYGPGKRADKAVVQAIQANPFVPMYLLGLKPLPRRLPEYVGIGDENEAVAYIAEAAENWLQTSGALEWLADVLVRHAPAPPDAVTRPPSRR